MQMQLGSEAQIPDGLLAANALLGENSHQGVPTSTHALYQGFGFVISNTALGLKRSLYDEGVESRYTGKERDTESGLDYFGARYYGSNMGRFMSPDPSGLAYANITNPQSFNLYAYAQNNPLVNVDPTGLSCVYLDDGTAADDGDGKGCADAGINPDGSEAPSVQVTVTAQPDDIDTATDDTTTESTAPSSNKCFSPTLLQRAGIKLQASIANWIGHPFGLGLGASAGAGFGKGLGLAGTVSAQMIVNPNGNAFLVGTYGGSGLTTPWFTLQTKGAGIAGGFQVSSMTSSNVTLSDLQGNALDAAFGGGRGFGGGADFSFSGGIQGTATIGAALGGYGGTGVITNAVAIASCSNHP